MSQSQTCTACLVGEATVRPKSEGETPSDALLCMTCAIDLGQWPGVGGSGTLLADEAPTYPHCGHCLDSFCEETHREPCAPCAELAPNLRYAYRVAVGEACAICSEVRTEEGDWAGWWWHSTCRGTTDPEGRRFLLTAPDADIDRLMEMVEV